MASAGVRTITPEKLTELETSITEEGVRLASFKESLEKCNQLTRKMDSALHGIDNRIRELEPVIIPLNRSIKTLSCISSNVSTTESIVASIMDKVEMARKEEMFLLNPPTLETLNDYLESMERVSSALDWFKRSNLAFCHITMERLNSISVASLEVIMQCFKAWVAQSSSPINPVQASQLGSLPWNEFPEELYSPLLLISGFISMCLSEEPFQRLVAEYVEIRSNFLIKSLAALFKKAKGSDSDRKAAYQRGAHPIILAFNLLIHCLLEEEELLFKVLPRQIALPVFLRIIKPIKDTCQEAFEHISNSARKAFGRREFADQIFIFDIVEECNKSFIQISSSAVADAVTTSLKMITLTGVAFFTDMMEDVKNSGAVVSASSNNATAGLTGGINAFNAVASAVSKTTMAVGGAGANAANQPVQPAVIAGTAYTLPANATVFAQTSTLLNCLKKMLEYEHIIESILSRSEQNSWNGIVGVVPEESPNFAMGSYYAEALKLLETSLDVKSKLYKKAVQSLIFQLNNYNFILRTFKTSNLASMVTIESEKRYEDIVGALTSSFLSNWSAIANILADPASGDSATPSAAETPKAKGAAAGALSSMRGLASAGGQAKSAAAATSPRDRLKTFITEIDEALKVQGACAVPDADLRRFLRSQINEIVLEAFNVFYNSNQALFAPGHSRSVKYDPVSLGEALGAIFES